MRIDSILIAIEKYDFYRLQRDFLIKLASFIGSLVIYWCKMLHFKMRDIVAVPMDGVA